MKRLIRISILVAAAIGIQPLLSAQSLADEHLDHSGKLDLQVDRISQDDDDIKTQESQSESETELEKIAPGLFKKQTRAAVQKKQKELDRTVNRLKEEIFADSVASETKTNIYDAKKTLFSQHFFTQHSSPAIQSIANHAEKKEGVNQIAIGFLSGFAVMLVGGILALIRKIME